MSIKEQLTLAAGLAVALATAALFPVFQGHSWLVRTVGAVLAVVLAGLAGRRLGVPRPLQPLLGLVALAGYLGVVFAGQTLSYGLVPTGRTLEVLRVLVEQGRADIQRYGPPVPPGPGLVLLCAAGVGAVALVVDLVAVVLDRAAVAGLPLLLLFAIPSAVLPGGLGGVPFVLGAVGWLGLLLVEGSERVGRWGTPMRSALPGARAGGDDSSLGRVGRRIGFAALGAAVVLPALVPGLDQRLLGGTGSGAGDGDGGSHSTTTFNPIARLHGQLSLPRPKVLFSYQTDDPDPDYLRMTTLERYSATGWSASNLEGDPRRSKVQEGIPTLVGDRADRRDLSMTVTLAPDQLDVYWLPVPFGPTRVDVTGKWLWDASSETVFSAVTTTRELEQYGVTASRLLPNRDALAGSDGSAIDRDVARKYGGALPVTPRVSDLTSRIVRNEPTAYDRAVAIQEYFTSSKNGFVYSFDAPPATNGDALEAFLDGKRGFCEQYATAMAVLLRVAGIPSRVAVGFTRGHYDQRAGVWTVTTSDAHAWPEAWFPGSGWVRFEPTPAANGAVVPAYSVPPQAGGTPLPTASATPTATASAAPGASARPPGQRDPGSSPALTRRAPGSSGPSALVLTPIVLAGLLAVPFLLSRVRRRRRSAQPGALAAWEQLQDDATDVGHAWHPADSPRAAAARLAGTLPAPAVAALGRVALAAEQVRYARPGRADPADLSADVGTVRQALLAAAPARVRLRARLFPTSTLRWATNGLSERGTSVLNGLDDAISALTRPIRRRAAPR